MFVNTEKYKILNINLLNNLNLNKICNIRYPMINILNLINENNRYLKYIVSANDELVSLFLNNKIQFIDIYKKLFKFIKLDKFIKYRTKKPNNIEDIIKLNDYVKTYIRLNFKRL